MAEKTCCLLGGSFVFNELEATRFALKSIKFLIEQRGISRFYFCSGGQSVRLMLKAIFTCIKKSEKTPLPCVEIVNYKTKKSFIINKSRYKSDFSSVVFSEILSDCGSLGDYIEVDLSVKMLSDSNFCISYVPLVFEGAVYDKRLCAVYRHAFKSNMKICNLSVSPVFFGEGAAVY